MRRRRDQDVAETNGRFNQLHKVTLQYADNNVSLASCRRCRALVFASVNEVYGGRHDGREWTGIYDPGFGHGLEFFMNIGLGGMKELEPQAFLNEPYCPEKPFQIRLHKCVRVKGVTRGR